MLVPVFSMVFLSAISAKARNARQKGENAVFFRVRFISMGISGVWVRRFIRVLQ